MDITKEMYLLAKKIIEDYEYGLDTKSDSPKLKQVVKEIEKDYYWKRSGWETKFSGLVTIKKEGGSNRTKGWQVRYVDNKIHEATNEICGLPNGTYSTCFANDNELFEVVN